MATSSKSKVLIEGILYKKGQINMSWKQRYFLLYDNGIMLYYENYNESKNVNKNDENKSNKKNNEINLNEVKSFSIITREETTKKSDREYTFQVITDQRTYSLSCQHLKSFNKWTKYIEQYVYGKIINKGYLEKLGLKRKKWKKRWFILYDSKKLMYYDSDNKLSVAKGVINLKSVSGLGYGQEQQYQSKTVIEIKTSTRIWALKCLNEKDLKQWFDHILKVMNNNTLNQNDKLNGRTKALSDATKPTKKLLSSPKQSPQKSPSLHVQSDSMFNIGKQISIDFNLSDDLMQEDKPLSLLPENGKFIEDKPFKFSSDKKKQKKRYQETKENEGDDGKYNGEKEESINKPNITSIVIDDENNNQQNSILLLSDDDEDLDGNEYRKIQIDLYKEWEDIMKDVVIDKKHTLAMDAASDFCIKNKKREEINRRENSLSAAMTPTNPDKSFIASIPKVPSRDFDNDADIDAVLPSDDILTDIQFDFDKAPDIARINSGSSTISIPKKLPQRPSISKKEQVDDDKVDEPNMDDIEEPDFPEEIFSANAVLFEEIGKDELSPKSQKKVNKEQKFALFENCQCISRILIILRAYQKWINYKTGDENEEDKNDKNDNKFDDNEGFRGMISILKNYTIKDLLNDYYHIKMYHCESTKSSKRNKDEMMSDVIKTAILDPDICSYFKKNIGTKCSNVTKCICIKRLCNEKQENQAKRRNLYLLNDDINISNTKETVEIVTQQILDMIYCYVFHLSYCIRNVIGENKNKFVTITKSDKEEEKPDQQSIENDEDKDDDEDKENGENEDEDGPPMRSMERQYSRWDSHHGADIAYNDNNNVVIDKMKDTATTPKYSSIKFEVLNCDNNITEQEWIEIYYKSELLLQSFKSLKLKCKKDLMIEDNDKKVIKKNEHFKTEYVLAISLYCNHDSLRNELIMSYRNQGGNIIKNHYHKFYHFGLILYIIINGYGRNMYDTKNNISSMESTSFYHCFSNPVLFQNLRCDFNGGPVSMTIVPSIVFTSMYIDKFKQGIIVEMDIISSGMTNYFDVSIYSNFAYESERLFYGKISLSITNIIESDISSSNDNKNGKTMTKFNYHSNYLNAITLLRMIIGDCTMQKVYYQNEIICERLTLLISLEINYRRMLSINKQKNKNMNKRTSNKQLVPEYIGKLFHSWCMNTKGVIVLKLDDIQKLSQTRLQSYFLVKPRVRSIKMRKMEKKPMKKNIKNDTIKENDNNDNNDNNNISLSYRILFQIFPFVTKILCYGIPFNQYLAKTFTDFLISKEYINNLQNMSKVNECILQFDNNDDEKWNEYEELIIKYQQILDENGSMWSIKAKMPTEYSLDQPKISFVKNNKSDSQ